MKLFGNLSTEGLEQSGDVLGGGGVFDTDVYENGTIKLAYAGTSRSSDAQSVTVHIDFGGREYRETFWITNRNGENSYQDKRDPKKKHVLPGFQSVDDLCLVTTGAGLAEQDIAEKVVQLYDFEAKAEVPQNVPVLIDLLGKNVSAAVIRQTVNKQKKNDQGVYVDTGETRDENIIDKFFHAESRRTVTEAKNGIEDPIFIDKWAEKNRGKTRDRTGGAQGNTGAPGRLGGAKTPPVAGSTKPKTSLFGN